MHESDPYFDEDSRPVPAVDFDYDGLEGQPPDDSRVEKLTAAIDAINGCMDFVFRGGHKDAMPVRLAAVAVAFGYFRSQKQAAKESGVSRSCIHKAVRRLGNWNTPKNSKQMSANAIFRKHDPHS